jgi:hypothetical protein
VTSSTKNILVRRDSPIRVSGCNDGRAGSRSFWRRKFAVCCADL